MNTDYRLVDIYSPQFIIPVYQLSQPSDLYSICSKFKMEVYCYAIYYKQNLLRLGISHPAQKDRINTNTFGERLVRQISKAPGWTKPFINTANNKTTGTFIQNYGYISESENGMHFKDLIEEYEKLNNVKIDKDELYIHIWNLTNKNSKLYHFDDSDKGRANKALYFEAILIDQYKMNNLDKLPLGNVKHDPSIFNKVFHIPKITHSVAQMFEGI